MKDRRGFFLAETLLKIVIALIALGILFAFLFSLYYNHTKNKELEQAEATLERLVEEINANSGDFESEVYGPEGWYFSSWGGSTLLVGCSALGWTDCICLCDDLSCGGRFRTCLENDYRFSGSTRRFRRFRRVTVTGEFVEINSVPFKLKVDQTNKKITKA